MTPGGRRRHHRLMGYYSCWLALASRQPTLLVCGTGRWKPTDVEPRLARGTIERHIRRSMTPARDRLQTSIQPGCFCVICCQGPELGKLRAVPASKPIPCPPDDDYDDSFQSLPTFPTCDAICQPACLNFLAASGNARCRGQAIASSTDRLPDRCCWPKSLPATRGTAVVLALLGPRATLLFPDVAVGGSQ
ncbi:hypothetical protein B0T25DRAFT_181257 [Lasiosphaeria hispida]|uniref:Uncharacterized protein n=1 Tax=Lasiosphaeria hispida TaxID=260671 RepID=A0AAJ0HGN2_9PEZI|nr:hypothetical protein B0T25DRAFT_181257 [Lasiosphaeria hispida]